MDMPVTHVAPSGAAYTGTYAVLDGFVSVLVQGQTHSGPLGTVPAKETAKLLIGEIVGMFRITPDAL